MTHGLEVAASVPDERVIAASDVAASDASSEMEPPTLERVAVAHPTPDGGAVLSRIRTGICGDPPASALMADIPCGPA